ncbi:MAG: DUF2807 domain-containing protein [Bacteroidota bacterium]|nr:MAG: DUF2807 domain-containing protein [Bacteroidota bacterium]
MEVSGSGIIQGMGGIQTQALDLVVSGSGEINLPTLQAQMLDADISGSGKVTVSAGSCPKPIHKSVAAVRFG